MNKYTLAVLSIAIMMSLSGCSSSIIKDNPPESQEMSSLTSSWNRKSGLMIVEKKTPTKSTVYRFSCNKIYNFCINLQEETDQSTLKSLFSETANEESLAKILDEAAKAE